MKLLLLEVELNTQSNQMDLYQEIQVINPKDNIVSPEERHKGKIPELPLVPKESHGPIKDRGSSEGLDTHVLQRTSPTDKSLVEKPKHVVRGPKEEVGPREGQQLSGSSPSLHKQNSTSTSAKQWKANPKEQSEGQAKGKAQWKKPYPQKYRTHKKENKAMDILLNMARTLIEFKNNEEERMNQ
ncbi:hypothetical protein O181_011825 [Austropuccinia psidii MF-1]|uniref:Uncharacterized protein n=1 Tax=Austropuccinia psidii MF-1 TaxID=1389203 RepID=A0A9Q3BWN4_9BASI|nr:hypothetical protein [Austropuccinia psidii MF-1]